jgi:phospholipid/cholesterol/gamma-HCH transport system substrate-binding protein
MGTGMEARVNFVVVGIFVIVLSTSLIAGVLWLSSGKYYRRSYDVYQTYMTESVSGLNLDAPVQYQGVDVGRVRKIALAPDNVEQVQLTLDVNRGTPIKEDTVAMLRTQGLTGIAFVELMAGHRDAAPLRAKPGEQYPVIRSGLSLMSRLESSATVLLASVNRASEAVSALIDEENRRAIKKSLADLEVITHTLAVRSATIDAGLANAAHTMENTARFTAQLPQLVQRVERSAEAFDRMASQMAGAGASVSGTLDGARPEVQRFASETLPDVRELVAELRELTGSLRRVSGELEENPGILVYGRRPSKRGPGE